MTVNRHCVFCLPTLLTRFHTCFNAITHHEQFCFCGLQLCERLKEAVKHIGTKDMVKELKVISYVKVVGVNECPFWLLCSNQVARWGWKNAVTCLGLPRR